eukprot:GFUD01039235.1.p1 GENE.GFUD01039235.1~~GFUD01039235.1.p1  ORF type:complete len:447 (-),score=102.38 GFUD01039235.1:61-1401(-)
MSRELEGLAASRLCDESDPTLLSWKQLKRSWGPTGFFCCNFMFSYGLKPYNDGDIDEAVAISRGLKEMDDDDGEGREDTEEVITSDTVSGLPEVGMWIKYTIMDREFRCKVVSHESMDSCKDEGEYFEWVLGLNGYEDDHQFVVEYDDGEDDTLEGSFLKRMNWSCTPAPGKEELEVAVQQRSNQMLGYCCQMCKSTSTKMLRCKACKKVHYCDPACQRKDWPTHQTACVKEKVVLQPNPRYPLANVERKLGSSQKKIQKNYNSAVVDGLNGNFKIKINGKWVRNPKAIDLETSSRYELIHNSKGKVVHFKQRALVTGPHANGEPTSCDLLMTMELCMEDDSFNEGGLHYLVGWDDGTFWGMVLNFNMFGTVAPFNTACYCKFPKMPPKYKEMRKKWDKMFSRAKACFTDVQCMFANTTTGCHSFGLQGEAGCRFKHDIAVKKVKK